MKSVLIIEDHTGLRENIAQILELAGYHTLTAENGKKGLELAFKEKPDLVICDIMMPELDGYGVLLLLRRNQDTRNIPFIFLTAKLERPDFRKAMEMGADDYVTKPFEDVELLNAVDVRLKKSGASEKKYSLSQQGISEFLKDVKGAGLIRLSEQYNLEIYAKKQSIFHAGSRPKFLYYLISGKAKGFKTNEEGKQYITDIFSNGDFIGYQALIENVNYDNDAIVLEESEILQVPREDFLEMIYGDITVAARFIRIITQNVKEKEGRLLSMAYGSLRKRVAKALMDIHKKFNAAGNNKPIEISRDDIAHYIGTATESLVRTLSEFKMEKLIEVIDGKIRITNEEKLASLLF